MPCAPQLGLACFTSERRTLQWGVCLCVCLCGVCRCMWYMWGVSCTCVECVCMCVVCGMWGMCVCVMHVCGVFVSMCLHVYVYGLCVCVMCGVCVGYMCMYVCVAATGWWSRIWLPVFSTLRIWGEALINPQGHGCCTCFLLKGKQMH